MQWVVIFFALFTASAAAAFLLRRRGLDRWIVSYAGEAGKRRPPPRGEPIHVLLCVCDHYEPKHGGVSAEQADARVRAWVEGYPRLFGGFRDSDGRPPRHSFFFPLDLYMASHLDELAKLCRAGYGEVEIHLHHDRDSPDALRKQFLDFKKIFADRHGLLPRDRLTGEVKYGFIHGNWALDNSLPGGRWCGVNNELDILRETGCYADFTLPSAPSAAQTHKINSIYYAVDDPHRPKSHNTGVDVSAGRAPPPNGLMLIQGPLMLNWTDRTGPGRLMPRIENANLQGSQPPTLERLDLWLRARVQVPSRPDWYFVKLHTHGAPEWNQEVVLGQPMVRFHEGLARRASEDGNFRYHYVTAREMYNLAKAAEAGWQGTVEDARDFELIWHSATSVSTALAGCARNATDLLRTARH
jgi:hypothetical protein